MDFFLGSGRWVPKWQYIHMYTNTRHTLHARRPVPEPEKSIEEIVQSHGAKAFARFAVNVVRRKRSAPDDRLDPGRRAEIASSMAVGSGNVCYKSL